LLLPGGECVVYVPDNYLQ